jgi:hypothetical protein
VETDVLAAQLPIEPTNKIILTVCVVVASLRPPYFISHQKNRYTETEEIEDVGIANLPLSKGFDLGIIGRPFLSAIPGEID